MDIFVLSVRSREKPPTTSPVEGIVPGNDEREELPTLEDRDSDDGLDIAESDSEKVATPTVLSVTVDTSTVFVPNFTAFRSTSWCWHLIAFILPAVHC